MGSLRKHKNGKWRAEVRKQHRYISKIFESKGDGSKWIRETEIKIEKESFEDFRDSAHLSLANLITRYQDEIRHVQHADKDMRKMSNIVENLIRRYVESRV